MRNLGPREHRALLKGREEDPAELESLEPYSQPARPTDVGQPLSEGSGSSASFSPAGTKMSDRMHPPARSRRAASVVCRPR